MLKRWVQDRLKNVYWKFRGRGLKNPLVPDYPKLVVFVCKGNICRSPFAQKYATKAARTVQEMDCTFLSAGLQVSTMNPSPSEAVIEARKFGIDIGEHRSTGITEDLLTRSD